MSNKKTIDDWKKEVQRLRNKLSRMQRTLDEQKLDMQRVECLNRCLEREVGDARILSHLLSQLIDVAAGIKERDERENRGYYYNE